jgi:hypothetical protein
MKIKSPRAEVSASALKGEYYLTYHLAIDILFLEHLRNIIHPLSFDRMFNWMLKVT